MKNREKYRDEIIKSARTPEERLNACEFIGINVLPHFGAKDCCGVNCAWCKFLVDLWLDEEYEDPEVDWDKVPVDTLVKYATWNSGRTSKTAEGTDDFTTWRYCEQVEDEDGNSSI